MSTLSSPITTAFGATATLTTVTDSAEALRTATHLRSRLAGLFTSVVPGADTVLVNASAETPLSRLLEAVNEALTTVPADPQRTGRIVTIPVRYTGEDLAAVADLLAVSTEEVVARHTRAEYTVDFLGFAPGFPYLSGLDPFLSEVPRLDTPRTRVPAGSVGLAAGKTCVYPSVSPGGWRLLGATDLALFNPTNDTDPALLSPGDRVRFSVVR